MQKSAQYWITHNARQKIALNNFVTWLRNRLSLHSHKTAYLRSTHAVLHFLLRCDKDSYDSSDCRTPYDTFYSYRPS